MLDKHALGRAIRARRLAQGLTLRELAEKAALSHSAVDNIEHGRQNVTLDTLQTVARALGLEVDVEVVGAEPGPRDVVIARVARILPRLPDEDLDVFLHEVALWERRYGS